MRPPAAVCLIVVSLAAAALLGGCGGGGSSAGSSSTRPKHLQANPGGPIKKATAPNAPAGSKVTSCPGGGAGVSGLRAVAMDCGTARSTMRRWRGSSACRVGAGRSRASCSLGALRCQAIRSDRGIVVSCARADGSDVSFIAKG